MRDLRRAQDDTEINARELEQLTEKAQNLGDRRDAIAEQYRAETTMSGARAAANDLYLYGGGLTPELAELIKQAFRVVHLLAYLKDEELDRSDRKDLFDRAAADARTTQDETLGADEPTAATLDTPFKTSARSRRRMTGFRFIHSSDLHLGRRFGNYPEDFRGRLVEARHAAIDSLSSAARDHGTGHVLIAGDLFDTETPSDRVWRQALAAMAAADNIDWWIIPGNHDSLAAEALWDPIRAQRPDNMHICDAAEPVEIEPGVTLLPSPVPSRFPGRDATEWIPGCATPDGSLRVGLAHGGIVTFGSEDDGTETIPPDRATSGGLDYLALGDWHGFVRVGDRTYYSGSPERDRFKHQGRGVCLAVTIPGPGAKPEVAEVATGRFGWYDIPLPLTPEQNASDALAGALPKDGSERRDTLVRVQASGWTRLPQRMELARAAEDAAPEFGCFELSDAELATECAPEDLDDIAPGGALRVAAEILYGDADDAAMSAEDRAIAAAALRRLYGYVTEDAR